MREQQVQIINKISVEILCFLNIAANEEYAPRHEADEMDHLIADAAKRAEKLRAIRNDLEHIFTGKLY